MVRVEIPEVPDTWDTIKYTKPIFPTYSQGKFGGALYCNSKYHCYSVQHSKPTYDLTPYRAPGFGYAARSMKYVPLTHIQDRTKPKTPKDVNEKSRIRKIYEDGIDEVKLNAELRNERRIQEAKAKAEMRELELKYGGIFNKIERSLIARWASARNKRNL